MSPTVMLMISLATGDVQPVSKNNANAAEKNSNLGI
jgi:hypothetical protein